MAVVSSKRARKSDLAPQKAKIKGSFDKSAESTAVAGPSKPKTTISPRTAPSFLSSLKDDQTDFPRGGGSSLTPIELKQIKAEGRKEADAENEAEVSTVYTSSLIAVSGLIIDSGQCKGRQKDAEVDEREGNEKNEEEFGGGAYQRERQGQDP